MTQRLARVFFLLLLSAAPAAAQEEDPAAVAAERVQQAAAAWRRGDVEGREQSLAHLREAVALYRKAGDSTGLRTSLNQMGQSHLATGRADSALIYHRRALEVSLASGGRKAAGNTRGLIGNVFFTTGRGDSALHHYAAAAAMLEAVGDRTGLAVALTRTGMIHRTEGRGDSALAYLRRALDTIRTAGNPVGQAVVLRELGGTLAGAGRLEDALDAFRESLRLSSEAGAVDPATLGTLGQLHRDTGRLDSALVYVDLALDRAEERGDLQNRIAALTSAAELHVLLGRPDSADALRQRALVAARTDLHDAHDHRQLGYLATLYRELDRPDSARVYFRRALEAARAEGDPRAQIAALSSLSDVLAGVALPDSALAHRRAANRLLEELGELDDAAMALTQTGQLHQQLGHGDSARFYFRRALGAASRVGERAEMEALIGLAMLHEEQNQADSAAAYHRRSLRLARELGTSEARLRAASSFGLFWQGQGQPDSALTYHQHALEQAESTGDLGQQAETLGYMGSALRALGRHDEAYRIHERSLELARNAPGRATDADQLREIGSLLHELGRSRDALDYLRQALALAPNVASYSRELHRASVYNLMGMAHGALGEPDSAYVYGRLSAELSARGGSGLGELSGRAAAGSSAAIAGRADSALVWNRRALELARAAERPADEVTLLTGLSSLMSSIGRQDSAVTYAATAARVAEETGDPALRAQALLTLGGAQIAFGKTQEAEATLRSGVELAQGHGLSELEVAFLNALGNVLVTVDPDSAVSYFLEAHDLEQGRAEPGSSMSFWRGMAYAELFAGHLDLALEHADMLLMKARETGSPGLEADALKLHTAAHLVRQSWHRAAAYADSTAHVESRLRRHAGGDANRLSFAEQSFPLYGAWAAAWLSMPSDVSACIECVSDAAEGLDPFAPENAELAALAALERGRAQGLLDLMHGSDRAAVTVPQPGADMVAEGRALAQAATAGEAAVMTYLLYNGGAGFVETPDVLVTWLVLPDGRTHTATRLVDIDAVAAAVDTLREVLGVGGAAARSRLGTRTSLNDPDPDLDPLPGLAARPWQGALRDMASLLLPPDLIQRLPAEVDLVVVPQGPLALIPFAALPLPDGTPLGLRYALRYAPSLRGLAEARARPLPYRTTDGPRSAAGALVVGNPAMPAELDPLPGAAAEANSVADLLGTTALIGGQALEARVRDRVGEAPVVHLATHGLAYSSEARVRDSWIALAPGAGEDGLLTVAEILEELPPLRADLIALSACQTGLGDIKQAEGTVGLQRALLARGARSVLVSLWNVDDTATSSLMRLFYQHWLSDPDRPTKAEALRRAQETLRTVPRYRHPAYWAPFQLVGAP